MTRPTSAPPTSSLGTLVVGGTGRVGAVLQRIWAGRADVVFQQRGAGKGPAWEILDGPGPILEWMASGHRPGTMVVLAGVTPGAGDLSLNAALAETCLAAAHEGGVPKVLYASSSAVYGPGRGTPLDEDAPTAPANAYGAAKLAAEDVCARYRGRGLDVTALRIGNIAGTDQLCRNADKATMENPLKLDRFPDGHGPRRSYVAPSTFARVIETLCQAPALPPVLNVAAPGAIEMEEILKAHGAPWGWVPAPSAALQNVTLDCARLQAIHGFAPVESTAAHMLADWRRWSPSP